MRLTKITIFFAFAGARAFCFAALLAHTGYVPAEEGAFALVRGDARTLCCLYIPDMYTESALQCCKRVHTLRKSAKIGFLGEVCASAGPSAADSWYIPGMCLLVRGLLLQCAGRHVRCAAAHTGYVPAEDGAFALVRGDARTLCCCTYRICARKVPCSAVRLYIPFEKWLKSAFWGRYVHLQAPLRQILGTYPVCAKGKPPPAPLLVSKFGGSTYPICTTL